MHNLSCEQKTELCKNLIPGISIETGVHKKAYDLDVSVSFPNFLPEKQRALVLMNIARDVDIKISSFSDH